MKLGYLVPEFPAQTHAFFWREVLALRSLGHEVQLLSTRRPDPGACRHAFAGQATRETLYVYPPSSAVLGAALRAVRRMPGIARYLSSLSASHVRERAQHLGLLACALELCAISRRLRLDHIHVHSAANTAHIAALARLLGGPPYSVTLHGDLEVYGRDHVAKFKDAKFVATVTRPLQGQVVGIGVPEERVKVIWMGVDTAAFTPDTPRLDSGPLRLATVARLHPNKGHRFALAALRRLLDDGIAATYAIAGAGDARAEIEQVVRSLALQDVVQFVGTISEQDVLALLRATDVFILPSVGLGEAAPVSVMEAMSCASVVVVSRIGGTPDLIDNEVDGFLVDQGEVDGIFLALQRLAKSPSLRRRIGAAARAKAIRLFDCHATAALLARAISQDEPSPVRA